MAAASLLLAVLAGGLARSQLEDPRRLWRALCGGAYEPEASHHRHTLAFLVLAAVASLLLAFTVDTVAEARGGILPLGYALAASVDLNAGPHKAEAFYAFHLDHARPVRLIVALENYGAEYTQVSLLGLGNESWEIVQDRGEPAAYDHIAWRAILPAGDYRVVIDTPQDQGKVLLYVKGLGK
jgi:hypothetical protein